MESNKIKLGGWLMTAGILVVMLGLAACGGGSISSSPAGAKKPEVVAPPPSEEEGKETKLVWSYDPTDKRDPFKLPAARGPEPYPLRKYPLEQMWIDGIVLGGGANNVAHIILPDNSDWFVKVGDIIGINSGGVKEIKSDGILVEEQYLDPVDLSKIRIVEKFLRMETENAPPGLLK